MNTHTDDMLVERTQRQRMTRDLFDSAADGYDTSSALGFLWSDRWYRRRELLGAGLREGCNLLDVGGGSGRTAIIAQAIVGPAGRVVLVDPSARMRAVAERHGVRETREGSAEHLPASSDEFDVVMMAYMIRHVHDRVLAFREAYRVLRPMGRICVLEVCEPRGACARSIFRLFASRVLPALSLMASGRRSVVPMMRYWAETMRSAASPPEIVESIASAGFVGARTRCELGIFRTYRGIKPEIPRGSCGGVASAS
jgi:demethylmenaquinone methyltransferase/2-methoxy-6-polyprenyl-1,4-benzoquinol methylase